MKWSRIGLVAIAAMAAAPAKADNKYGPGVTDTEIKIGQSVAYSGPASAYGSYGRVLTAYFTMINAEGGINGRKVVVLSLDNAYSPPKAMEQVRKLLEEDGVLADMGTLGTAPNVAIQKYLNSHKVPHLVVTSGGSRFNDPKNYPWTVPFYPSYEVEGQAYAKYILATKPNAKIGVLYENDDLGKDLYKGLRTGLGDKAATMIVEAQSHELSDPTMDTQIIALQGSGADALTALTTTKFAAQEIRKVFDIGWKPLHIVSAVSSSIGGTLTPAGLERSVGLVTAATSKFVQDPAWADDQDVKDYVAFLKKWAPNENVNDNAGEAGYIAAEMMALILRRCGDELTRENLMGVATGIKDMRLPLLLPNITVGYAPDDYSAYHQLQLMRFDGQSWKPLGDVIDTRAVDKRS
jgi:branched-chain amino acid transport system substrate-binding protein